MNDKVKAIREWALANYEKGGDVIVECYSDAEIDEQFASLAAAKKFCKTRKDYAGDIRAA